MQFEGLMSGSLQNGQFSNVKKTDKLYIAGKEFKFDCKYLDMIQNLTGIGTRQVSLELPVAMDQTGRSGQYDEYFLT